MQDFDFELFERLKEKVLEGEATVNEYQMYKEMSLQKEEVVKEINRLENEVKEIDVEIRQLKRRKEELIAKLNILLKYDRTRKHTRINSVRRSKEPLLLQKDKAYSYISWHREYSQIYADGKSSRTGKEYRHNCPILHFQTIMNTSLELYERENIINPFDVEMELRDMDLGDGVIYREGLKYRVGVVLSILEQEGLIKWVEKKKPYRFVLEKSKDEIKDWFTEKIVEPWIKELYKSGNYREILKFQERIPQNETIKGIVLATKAKI